MFTIHFTLRGAHGADLDSVQVVTADELPTLGAVVRASPDILSWVVANGDTLRVEVTIGGGRGLPVGRRPS